MDIAASLVPVFVSQEAVTEGGPHCRRRAIAAAVEAQAPMAALASWQRREILEHCVTQFKVRADALALYLHTSDSQLLPHCAPISQLWSG